MIKDTTSMIKRAERFQIILIGEGILVGGIAGLVVLLYRICLEGAGKGLNVILAYARQSPLYMAGWFLLLMLMAVLAAKLLTYEPMISGSGIPQLEGEMVGRLEQTWWKVLPAKFAGGFLCMLGAWRLGGKARPSRLAPWLEKAYQGGWTAARRKKSSC